MSFTYSNPYLFLISWQSIIFLKQNKSFVDQNLGEIILWLSIRNPHEAKKKQKLKKQKGSHPAGCARLDC